MEIRSPNSLGAMQSSTRIDLTWCRSLHGKARLIVLGEPLNLKELHETVQKNENSWYEFRLREPLQLKFVLTFNLEQMSGILHGVECCLWMLEHVYKWKKIVVTFFLPIG